MSASNLKSLRKLQKEAYHLGFFILTIVIGICILFKGELAGAPQTMHGFPTAHRRIYGENRTFLKLIFIFKKIFYVNSK